MNIRPLLISALFGSLTVSSCAWALAPVVNDPSAPAGGAPYPNPAQTAASSKTLYDLMSRIDQLQNEVRELTGKVEEQAYQNAELKKRLSTMYSDFDERMQNLENKVSGGAAAPEAPAAENTGSEAPPADLDALQQPAAAVPAAPSEATPPAAPNASPAPAAEAPAVPAAPAAPAPAVPSEPSAAVAGDEAYKQAYDDLRNGRTTQSIEEFKAYLARNPSGPLSGNAQYWLGEAYRVNQDFSASRDAFLKVLEGYSNSPKVPDALLKLGYIEMDLNNKPKAGEYLNRVVSEFPNTNAARLAAKKLQSLAGQ